MKILTSAFLAHLRPCSFIKNRSFISVLSKKSNFSFSTSQVPRSSDRHLLSDGQLSVRNSQTLKLKLYEINAQNGKIKPLTFLLSSQETLNEIAEIFTDKFDAKNTQFYCEKHQLISKYTPIQALISRNFSIVNPQSGYNIKIQGQLLSNQKDQATQKASNQLKENLSHLELPVIAQRQIEAYFNRVSTWLDAKYGIDPRIKIKEKEAQDIIIQAIVDPQCQWTTLSLLQQEWFKKYIEIRGLRDKKTEAIKISEKRATRQMSLGLGLIAANIGFIWSGTYVFFSWDIIEPIAYFTSSLTSIILFGQVFKIKKPFSLENYRQYLITSYLPKVCEQIGLNLSDLQTKQMELQVVESIIKDYLISKL